MKKYIVFCEVGYAGMDCAYALPMPDNHTQEELETASWQLAVEHASRYGVYPAEEYTEDDEEDEGNYSHNIEGYAEPYDPELHDMKRQGGGSFQDDFKSYGHT